MKVGIPKWVYGNEALNYFLDSWLDDEDEIYLAFIETEEYRNLSILKKEKILGGFDETRTI